MGGGIEFLEGYGSLEIGKHTGRNPPLFYMRPHR
jgi:hypothetical protein